MARLCASPHSALYHHHLPSAYRLLTAHSSSLPSHISFIFDMSQPSSSSSTFRILFDAALQDYRDKTGNALIDHPIAKQLETCESVDSITTVLQEQAQSFREFTENSGRLMKAINSSVDILCTPSISSALNDAIGLVVRRKHLSVYLVPDDFYSHSRLQRRYSLASASYSPYVSLPLICSRVSP
jgi:hypothetical protein